MGRNEDPIEYVIEAVKASTDSAVLVLLRGHKDPVWIPRSQIEEACEVYETGDVITIPEWLANDRGIA